MNTCPNQFPSIEPCEARLALIGEFADADAVHFQSPLTGESGRLLDGALGHVGIARSSCYVGNIAQSPPPRGADFTFDWNSAEVQSGIEQLRADLEKFKPTMVLCLGSATLHLLKLGNVAPRRRGKDIDWPCKIGDWRGSLFESTWLKRECPECVQRFEMAPEDRKATCACGATDWTGELEVKCLAAHHPSAVLRDYSLQAFYRTGVGGLGDMERLRTELKTPELALPERTIRVYRTCASEAIEALGTLRFSSKLLSVDIEGYPGNITSIAFSAHADFAYVFPLADHDGVSCWSEEDEVDIWNAIQRLLEDAHVAKIAQNGQYDFFALAWTYGIVVRSWKHDTMLSHWENFAELEKGLAVQASLYTKEPFYKPDKQDGELKFASDEQFWRYNGLDACVTFECWERAVEMMSDGQRAHYDFNCELLPAVLFMMLSGIRFDKARATQEQEKAARGAMELQYQIDSEAAIQEASECDDWIALLDAVSELDEEGFAQIVLRVLGGKNPRVKVEIVEERWQPMKWNGRKWVKDGKLRASRAPASVGPYAMENIFVSELGPTIAEQNDWEAKNLLSAVTWLCPKPRKIERLQPFTPVCLASCEPYVLESKRGEWRRVKKVWKELIKNYDERTKGRSTSCSLPSGDQSAVTANGCDRAGSNSEPDQSAHLGELSTLLGLAVNIGSTNEGGDAQRFLYETCGLPRIYKDERTGRLSRETEGEWKQRIKARTNSVPTHAPETGPEAKEKADTRSDSKSESDLNAATTKEIVETQIDQGSVLARDGAQRNGVGSSERGFESVGAPSVKSAKNVGTSSGDSAHEHLGGDKRDRGTKASVGKRNSKTPPGKRLSTDQNAIDKLYAETQDVRVLWCLQQRRLKKVVTDLEKEIDNDGRIRASISLVKETGRMAASESPTGTGTNLQAWNKDLRHICVADEGCVLGQCDLEGADSWTVAAECAALGDMRMLEDLRAGMKPAKGLCYGYFDVDAYARGTPQELMALLKQREQPGWLYPGAKSCTHGSSYQMGWKTMIDTVLKFSMADLPLELKDAKPIMLTKAQVEKLQGAFLKRYPGIQRWHEKEGKDLLVKGWIETSTGHVRRIYGRKKRMEKGRMVADHSTLKEVLASKPQYYTTYAMKLMVHRMWYDPENRRRGELIVWPLLPVHDSILDEWKLEDDDFARRKHKEWFDNEMVIAGQKIVIPADGTRGFDWSMKGAEKL